MRAFILAMLFGRAGAQRKSRPWWFPPLVFVVCFVAFFVAFCWMYGAPV